MKYRREIDGMRAIAVLPVILYHAGFGVFSGGYLGVDVFFVLSGYLITAIILEQQARGVFSISEFYERRARRILPALFLVLACCLPFVLLWLIPKDIHEFSQSLLSVLGFISNVYFWRESDYFSTAADLKPLLHTWSLAVEEQYYLFYPLLITAIYRLGRKWLVPLICVGAAASLMLAQWQVSQRADATFFLLPTRAWELLLGAMVAIHLMAPRRSTPPQWLQELGSIIGLAMVTASVFTFTRTTPTPSAFTLVPTIGTCLVVLYATPTTLIGKLLGMRLLVGVGLVSYSAYLWHQPVFALARHGMIDRPGPSIMLALSALSLLLAYATWRFVERPFRDRSRIKRSTLVWTMLASTFCLASFGIAGTRSEGFRKQKIDARAETILASAMHSPTREACHYRDALRHPQAPCEYYAKPATWAVLGDSHAVELSYSLALRLKEKGAGLVQFSRSDCEPAYGNPGGSSECQRWTEDAVAGIIANKGITTVVVSYRINYHLFGGHEDVYPRLPAQYDEAQRSRRWRALVRILDDLVQSGKRVVYVLQAPELPKHVQYLTLVAGVSPDGDVAGVTRTWWNDRSQYARSRLKQIPEEVVIVDPADAFCDDATCYAVRHGTALYFDDNHMSSAGALVVAGRILPEASDH